jgi:hypothetical protein
MALALTAPACISIVLVVFCFSGEAHADSLRCGRRIVATGDSLHTVRSVCGEPTAQRRRVETRIVRRRVEVDCGTPDEPGRRCIRVVSRAREVQIDEWTYDFGPLRFVQYLTFVDGWLTTVEAGPKGTGAPRLSHDVRRTTVLGR